MITETTMRELQEHTGEPTVTTVDLDVRLDAIGRYPADYRGIRVAR